MGEEKRLKAKVIHKHELTENWNREDNNFIPENGQIVIYEDYSRKAIYSTEKSSNVLELKDEFQFWEGEDGFNGQISLEDNGAIFYSAYTWIPAGIRFFPKEKKYNVTLSFDYTYGEIPPAGDEPYFQLQVWYNTKDGLTEDKVVLDKGETLYIDSNIYEDYWFGLSIDKGVDYTADIYVWANQGTVVQPFEKYYDNTAEIVGSINVPNIKIGNGVDKVRDLPFVLPVGIIAGEAEDSLVSFISTPSINIKENKAVAKYSISTGVSNISGALVFNIVGYNSSDMTYTLDSPLPEKAFNVVTNKLETIPIGTNGALYSVMFPSTQRHFLGNIVAISEDRCTVTVNSLRGSLETGNNYIPNNDCYLKLPYYPLAGNISNGIASFTAGNSNVATADYSYSSGYNNISDGKYSVTLGRENEAAWSSAAIGARNKSHGLGSCTFGLDNKSTEMGAVAINQYNVANNSRAFVAGIGNHSSASNQTVVGQYNQNNSNALFIVGNGTGSNANVTSRSNAFVVLKDGRAKITAPPTENMDVVNKNYVDTKENDLKTQINNTKKECKAYTDNVITNLDVPSGLEVGNPLGSSPIILDHQPAGTKMDLKFSYSDPIETDITYALYANNLLIKPVDTEITHDNISPATIVCDEYGVISIPAATNSGGTFYIKRYNANKLFPFATSGKITVAMHTDAENTSNTGIQLRFEVYYLENGTNTIKVHTNGLNYLEWQCTPGISKVVDLDEFTQKYGKIVGIEVSLVWNKNYVTANSFKIYPAIYRGEVDVDPLTIPQDIANSQIYKTIANNSIESITLPEGIRSIVAAYPSVEIYDNGKKPCEVTIYKSFEKLAISQVYSASKLEAGNNVVFENNNGVLTINTTGSSAGDAEMTLSDESIEGATTLKSIKVGEDSWNILPEENKQAGAFLRLDSNLNPVWQMIPNAEDTAF